MKSISHKFQVFNKTDLEKAILKATWNDELVPSKKKHFKKCLEIFQGKSSIDNYAILMNHIKQISLRKWVYSAKLLLIIQCSINNAKTEDLCDYIHHDQDDLKKLRQDLLKNVVKPPAHQEQFKYLISQFLFYYFKYIMKFARHANIFVNKSTSLNKNNQKQMKDQDDLNDQETIEKQLDDIEIVLRVADIILYLFEKILQYLLIPKYAERHQFLKTITVALFEDLSKQYLRCKYFCEEQVPQIFDYEGMNSIVQRLYQFYCELIKLSKSISKIEFILSMCKPYIPTVLAIDYFVVHADKNRDIEIFVNNCNKQYTEQNFNNYEYNKNGFSSDIQYDQYAQGQDADMRQEISQKNNINITQNINQNQNNIQKMDYRSNKNERTINYSNFQNSQNKQNVQYNNLFDDSNNQQNSHNIFNRNFKVQNGINNVNNKNVIQNQYFSTNQISQSDKLIENNHQNRQQKMQYETNKGSQNNMQENGKNTQVVDIVEEHQNNLNPNFIEKQKLQQFNNIINQEKKQSLTSILAQKSYFSVLDEEKQAQNLQFNLQNEQTEQDNKKQVKKTITGKNASKSPSKFKKQCTIEDIVDKNVSQQFSSSSFIDKLEEDDLREKISGKGDFFEQNQLTFHYEQQVIMNMQTSQPDSSIGSNQCKQKQKKRSNNKITPSRQAIITQNSINYTQGNDDFNFSIQSIKNKNKIENEKNSPNNQVRGENYVSNNQDQNNIAFRIIDSHNNQTSNEDKSPQTILNGISYKQNFNENSQDQSQNNQFKLNKRNNLEDLNQFYSQSAKSSNRYKKQSFSSQFRQKKNQCIKVAVTSNINDFYQSDDEDEIKISQDQGKQPSSIIISNKSNSNNSKQYQNFKSQEDENVKCPESISNDEELQQQNKPTSKQQQIFQADTYQQSLDQTDQILKVVIQEPELFDDFQINYNQLNTIVQHSDDQKNNQFISNQKNSSYLNIHEDKGHQDIYNDYTSENAKQNSNNFNSYDQSINNHEQSTIKQYEQSSNSQQLQQIQNDNSFLLIEKDKLKDKAHIDKIIINKRQERSGLTQNRLIRKGSISCSQINENFQPETRTRQSSINKEINSKHTQNRKEYKQRDETSELIVHKIDKFDFNLQSSEESSRFDQVLSNIENKQQRSPKLEESGFSSRKNNSPPLSTSKSDQNAFFVGSNSISQNFKQEWINNNVKKASFSCSIKSEELNKLKKNTYKFQTKQQQVEFQSRERNHSYEENTARKKLSSYQLTTPREKSFSDKSYINKLIQQQSGFHSSNQGTSIFNKQENNTPIIDKPYLTQKENNLIQSMSIQNQINLNSIGNVNYDDQIDNFNLDCQNTCKQEQDNFNIHNNEIKEEYNTQNIILQKQDFGQDENCGSQKLEDNTEKQRLQQLIQTSEDKKEETPSKYNYPQRKCFRKFSRNSSASNISSQQSWKKIEDPLDYKNQINQNNDQQKQIILNQFVCARKNSLVSLKVPQINKAFPTYHKSRSSVNIDNILPNSSTNREYITRNKQESITILTSDNQQQFNNQKHDDLFQKQNKEISKMQSSQESDTNSNTQINQEQNHIYNNGSSNTELKISISPQIQPQNIDRMEKIGDQQTLSIQRKQSLSRRISLQKNDSSVISQLANSSSELNVFKNNTKQNKFNDFNFQMLNNVNQLQAATSSAKAGIYTNYSKNSNGNSFINFKIHQGSDQQFKSPYKIKNDDFQQLKQDRIVIASTTTNKNAIFFNSNTTSGKGMRNMNGSFSSIQRQINEQQNIRERLRTENLNDKLSKDSDEDIRKQLNKLDNDKGSTSSSSQQNIQMPPFFNNGRKYSNQIYSNFNKKDPFTIETSSLLNQNSKSPINNLFSKQSQSQSNQYLRNQFNLEENNNQLQQKQSDQQNNILSYVTTRNEVYQLQNKTKLNENNIQKLVQKQKQDIDPHHSLNQLIHKQKQQITDQLN